jgi:hypothetical protein
MRIMDATANQLRQFYGYVPRVRAWVAVEYDRVVAVAGYRFEPGRIVVFADLNDEIRRHPVKMLKTGRALVAEAKRKGMPIYVKADLTVPRSKEFLERIGFMEPQ